MIPAAKKPRLRGTTTPSATLTRLSSPGTMEKTKLPAAMMIHQVA